MNEELETTPISTHYKLGHFKVENLEEELPLRGVDFQFDLSVSRWTMRHLVDPAGTLVQTCNVLNVGGLFLFDGFRMGLRDQEPDTDVVDPRNMMCQLLDDLEVQYLISHWDCGYCLDQFCVRRTTEETLQFPWSYSGTYISCTDAQVFSKTVTCFDIQPKLLDYTSFSAFSNGYRVRYFDFFFGSEELHFDLAQQGLLSITRYRLDEDERRIRLEDGGYEKGEILRPILPIEWEEGEA